MCCYFIQLNLFLCPASTPACINSYAVAAPARQHHYTVFMGSGSGEQNQSTHRLFEAILNGGSLTWIRQG
jgi:hypothetical protein